MHSKTHTSLPICRRGLFAPGRRSLHALCKALAGLLWVAATQVPLAAQGVEYVDPDHAMGIWDFNDASGVNQAVDSLQGTPISMQSGAAFSASGGGRSGQVGDRALDFGTVAGKWARIQDPAFMALLNQRNAANNRISVVFWQKWSTPPGNSSSVYFVSPSVAGSRGFQAHLPWSNGWIYFDSSGCCDSPAQRLVSGVPGGIDWQQWHHIALIIDAGSKEIWIDGQLIATQESGVSALASDWTEVLLGRYTDSLTDTLTGRIDDFAIFNVGLQPSQIAALAAGATPASLVVPPEDRPPAITGLLPAEGAQFHPTAGALGFTASTVAPNTISNGGIRMFLNGAEVTGSLTITGSSTQRVVSYSGVLPSNQYHTIRAEVTDQAAHTSVRTWSFDTADPATTPTHRDLDLTKMATASLSGLSADTGGIDGNSNTISETANSPGAYWELELDRKVRISRLAVVAPTGAGYEGGLNGAVVGVYDLTGQLVYQTTINSVAPGGTWMGFLPPGIDGRIVRISLPVGQTNGAGDHRIALAELRVTGDGSPAFGPLDLPAIATATQTSTADSFSAALAIDGNPATFSQTANLANSHWLLTLDRSRPVRRIELLNRADANSARMGGLTLRLLDAQSNTLATSAVTHPGAGGIWAFDVPAGVADARYIRVGLEDNALNTEGNHIVSLAEVSVLTGVNHALGTPSYMVRLVDHLPPPSHGNDGDYNTFIETTERTVDGYWETDLGTCRSLHSVRAVAYDGADFQQRLRHATVRLYDENHESVYSQRLSGTSAVFDIPLPGPVTARYVRVGFENKERSSPDGGVEWWLRLREVQAYGPADAQPGISGFSASSTQIQAGQSTTLMWQQEDLHELMLYPGIGSVGGHTDASGVGSLTVSPATSTEYILIGKNRSEPVVRHLTVYVDGQSLPPRISEFMAGNKLSLRDGYGDASDWIELHNPNDTSYDLSAHGLSDTPATPMKWVFPAGTTIAPHGYRIVFASNRTTAVDPGGFLHAGFALSAAGESVILTAPNGISVLDSIPVYPAQQDDLAYGRSLDQATGFLAPTPGAVNPPAGLAGWLAPPVFSHSRGFHDQAFALTLTQPDPAAELLISLDGSEPATPYTGPIPVNGSLAVRATVRRSGYLSPRAVTHTYLFRDSVMNSPLMNPAYTQGALATRLRTSLTQLPSICVSVPQLPDDRIEREASMEIIMPDGTTSIQENAGFDRVGGSWTEFAKKSYRLKFKSEFGARKLEFPLFRGFDRGVPVVEKINTLDLSACNHDMVERGFYMSNRFVEDTMLEMGSLNPHGRYVHLYVNGSYWGQYNAHERLDDDFLAEYLGGQKEDFLSVLGNDNASADFVPGTPEPPNRQPWETVRANMNSYAAIRDKVDIPQLIDFMLVFFYGDSEGEFRCAGPLQPGSGFKFWLADADGFLRTSALSLDLTDSNGPGGIFRALVTEGHPDFRTLLADRIYKHLFNNGALTPERNLARLNARMAEVRDSLIAECARWGYRTPENWEEAAQTIRTALFPQRSADLFAQLRDRGLYPSINPPLLSQHGGSVSQGYPLNISAGSGIIYYTFDGSDPRSPGGTLAAGALTLGEGQTTHVAMGAQWRYWDLGSLPAANWKTSAYNDSSWSTGAAPLGYGSDNEATVINYGNPSSKYPTSYFRKTFTVANPGLISGLGLGLVVDDGAVIYLNGTEIVRQNMPGGTIGYNTLAASAVGGDAKYQVANFTVPSNLLIAGVNVLAVEVHQASSSSSDLRFDLSLSNSSLPGLTLNGNTRIKTRLLSNGTWSALADAAFHVAHPLASGGPYVFNQWSATAAAGTYPSAMRFYQADIEDPVLAAPMDTPWTLAYNLGSRSRINGLDASGMAFINTGDPQAVSGAGFVGAAVLALNTQGAQDIRVTWTGGTVVPNVRDYGIRLQYRIGDNGEFVDVPGAGGNPVEYLRNISTGHSAVLGPVTLPQAAENHPLVELRWKYYFRSGASGARAQLRLDDIQVTAGPVLADSLVFEEVPATAQAGATAAPVVVRAVGQNGALAETFTGNVSIGVTGQPGIPHGTTTRAAVGGRVVFDDLLFPQPGTYYLTASAGGLASAAHAFPVRVVGMTELVMPRFIQGRQPINTGRVPFAFRIRLDGLLPNATYRYANQIVNEEDSPTLEGAGNMIFVNTAGGPFVRSTESPRFLAPDLNTRHGEFTSDANGSHTRWFVTEPSGNLRFDSGNTVRARILLNDGIGGDLAVHHLTASGPVQVISFGTTAADGSALFAETSATAKNFAVVHDDASGSSRPLAATPIESTGASIDSLYAPFYQNSVAGQASRWGTIIPNPHLGEIRRFEERDLLSGAIVSTLASPDAIFPSTGPSTGLEPIGVRVPPPGASAFAVWQSRHFALDQLESPALGGALGDADADQVSNLLEYAFGMDPLLPDRAGLPSTSIENTAGNSQLVFRYRRLLGSHGLNYLPQISGNATTWQDAVNAWSGNEETAPNPDGRTETVTRRLPLLPSEEQRFLRVRIGQP